MGFPLAKTLVSEGLSVKGSTTSNDKLETLTNADIDAFLIQLQPEGIIGNITDFLSNSTTVVINIPPGLRKNPTKDHVAEIKHLIRAIEEHRVPNVIYISSTSVFKDDENFPVIGHNTKPNGMSSSAKQLIEIEELLQNNTSFKTTIIRFAGLFDAERHPAKFLSGRTNISNPEAPVNLIHKNDCIEIISKVIKTNRWNICLNASFPDHPTKKDYYSAYCELHDLTLPVFNSDKKSEGKIIDSSKLEQLLNFTFQQGI